jgi:hypothetical protein
MGYLGLTPTTAQQNYLNIDDISGSFNGTTTSFALQVGGVAPVPFPVTNSCLISVGGVVQQPDDTGTDGFRISGGNIIFSSAPGTGEDFFGLVLAGADYLNVGANFPDGTVGTPSITFESDLNTGIYHPSADSIAITSGGTAALTVDSNQRVGIGTTSPGTKLQVDGSWVSNYGTLNITGPDNDLMGVGFRNTSTYLGGVFFRDGTAGDFLELNAQGSRAIRALTNGTERARIDSSGRLLVGTSTSRDNWFNGSGQSPVIQSESSTFQNFFSGTYTSSGNGAPIALLGKARGTSYQVVNNADGLGRISFQGADGAQMVEAAFILAEVDGTPGANDMPGRLVFSTTADGASYSDGADAH